MDRFERLFRGVSDEEINPLVIVEPRVGRKDQLRTALAEVRDRTLDLYSKVPEEFLRVRVHNFYSPIGWHFGHVGRTEEFWVCEATGKAPLDPHLTFLFADLAENPKDNRTKIPDREGTLAYLEGTRQVALNALEETNLSNINPLVNDGYAWSFAIQHECQHQETIAEMLQLIQTKRPAAEFEPIKWVSSVSSLLIDHKGGEFAMGNNDPHGYDNEQEAHLTKLASFRLAKYPVTAYEWSEFIDDNGYQRRELWSPEGWEWRTSGCVELPEYWFRTSQGFGFYGAFGTRAIHPDEPAHCISQHEALAYCNYRGLRLPSESEWEFAASFAGGPRKRHYGWGDELPDPRRANFGLISGGPTPVFDHPSGETPLGVSGLSGNVWEWTSSEFRPYPGFRAFPYEGYSSDHMKGAHRVCRGGSWATSPTILRNTFRNWYVPSYRQGFLGLRLASD